MSVIHWYRPAGDLRRHETRCAIHDGGVQEIADRMMARLKSQGHEVSKVGGDYTGADGPLSLWFDVIVRLRSSDGIRDPEDPGMTWEHAIVTPGELWALDAETTPTTTDNEEDHA